MTLTTIQVVAAVAALAALAIGAIWFVPRLQARRWQAAGLEPKEVAELENSARGTLVQLLGGAALILTFADAVGADFRDVDTTGSKIYDIRSPLHGALTDDCDAIPRNWALADRCEDGA